MTVLYPLLMKPCYKGYLWGGEKLKAEYGKEGGPDIIAESWELADHIDGTSIVGNGFLVGKTISELGTLDRNRIWGSMCHSDRFPLLVKLIDAKEKLSVQVHPSDDSAIEYNGEEGKAELWYIVNCDRRAYIYLGLKEKTTKIQLEEALSNGSICNLLNKVYVNRGDVYFVNPETIHAIGPGVVIAEIQQNSNTTFRMYDYKRKDKNGHYRELHLDRAIGVANVEPTLPSRCRSTGIMNFSDFRMTEMYAGQHFRAYKVDVHRTIRLFCDGSSFHHVLCVENEAQIIHNENVYEMKKGMSYLMPAALGEYEILGNCRILLSRL